MCGARVRKAEAAAWRPNWSSGSAKALASVLVFGALICASHPAAAQFEQQGPKLVGIGAVGTPVYQGKSVAVSADGNTVIFGGYQDNSETGAAWVFTRSGGVWTQQGSKLVGTGAGVTAQGFSVALSDDGNTAIVGGPDDGNTGAAWVFTRSSGVWTQQQKLGDSSDFGANQGASVALSGDGNTAVVGGPYDQEQAGGYAIGAAWVFTRSNGVWTQQGSKLVGTTYVGLPSQGYSVALSGDGNTLIEGGPYDNGSAGAAWLFTRSNGVWTQQGSKLVSNDAVGSAFQGDAVALSGDGNTAMVGGQDDNGFVGASWVFTRSGGVWTQQGAKLIGTEGGTADQGFSVTLSSDGNTAVEGGPAAGGTGGYGIGAAWVFTRSNGVWTQQGSQLVGTGVVGSVASQGISVALSRDGSTLIQGGPKDNSNIGAAWVFVTPHSNMTTHDFNGDGKSDILWRSTGGTVAAWLMNGGAVLQSAALGTVPSSYSVIGQHDFNGDGKADVVWRDSSGNVSMWFMNGAAISTAAGVGNLTSNWTLYGTADLNGDGNGDLLWRDSNSGTVAVWFMNGATVASSAVFGALPSTWTIIGDANGEIVWRDSAGDIALWGVRNGQVTSSSGLGTVTSNFVVQGVGDFNGDGNIDILWRDTTSGTLSIWFTNGTQVISASAVGTLPSNWSVAQIGDYDGNGTSDILLLDSTGDLAMWLMNGAMVSSSVGVGNVGTAWQVQNTNAN